MGEEGLSVEIRKKDAGAPRGASSCDTLIFSASVLSTPLILLTYMFTRDLTSLPISISFAQC